MSTSTLQLTGRLSLILFTALLVVLLVHFAGVALIRYYAEEILHPADPRGTHIGSVDLNLFTGTLEILDFELRNDGPAQLRAGQLKIKISPTRLLSGEVHVEHARLSNAFLRVDRRQDGSYDLGVPSFGDKEPAPTNAEPAPFSLAGARLDDVTIEYHDGEFTSVAQLVKIEIGAYSPREET